MDGTLPRYATVLVPLDGSPRAEAALPHAAALAGCFGSGLLLLRVTTPPAAITAGAISSGMGGGLVHPSGVVDAAAVSDAERRESADYLAALGETLRGGGRDVSTRVESGPVAEVILDVAVQAGAGLIAMTTHGRGGIGRLVYGSVAESVLRDAPCPVLIVRVEGKDTGPV
jgi:nucleotide-binding universal stress UspA family protein